MDLNGYFSNFGAKFPSFSPPFTRLSFPWKAGDLKLIYCHNLRIPKSQEHSTLSNDDDYLSNIKILLSERNEKQGLNDNHGSQVIGRFPLEVPRLPV